MPDDFNQGAAGPKKIAAVTTPKIRANSAYGVPEMAGAFRLAGWLCLSRHAREHIESASAMQSVRTRSETVGSQRFEPSIAHHLTPLRRRGEQASVAFSASERTKGALNGLRCIASAEALRVRIASSQVVR